VSQSISSGQHHRQKDSAVTSCHNQHRLGSAPTNVASAAPSPARPGNDITPWLTSTQQRHGQHRLGSATANIAAAVMSPAGVEGLARTSLTSNLTQRFTTDQSRRLQEYFFNWWPDSGTLLPTSPTSTRGEHIITTMLWETSSNQLSHIYNSIFFRVNTYVLLYFQLINIPL
jgi:hypothetical protein